MIAFLGKRLAMLIATLLVASFAIYGALYLAPGSPIAALTGGRSVPPEVLAQLEERYNLNEPFLVRYWIWLTGVVQGDLGESIPLRQDVSTISDWVLRVRPEQAKALLERLVEEIQDFPETTDDDPEGAAYCLQVQAFPLPGRLS